MDVVFAHPNERLRGLYSSKFPPEIKFHHAVDGISALRKVKLIHPHLVLSDYRLPYLSGLALLKYLKSHPKFHSIPFVFLTDHLDVAACLSYGANEWIPLSSSTPEYIIKRVYYHLK